MNSSRRFGAIAILAILFAGAGCDRPLPQPNLLFISMDTTRADRIGAYGYTAASTPTIDAMAAAGYLFRNHFTPVPITLPGHTTMMTGHYPPTHGVHDNGAFVVPPDELTLAEVLAAAGYENSAFVGSFPMTARFGLDQGFDHYDDKLDVDDRNRPGQLPGVFFDERNAGAVVDAAIAYHRDRDRRPFFTFIHLFDPHQPQAPPPPYDIEYRDRLYDGEIAYVDHELSRLFSFFSDRGDLDNTIVVITSDHGEGLGEHGELTHAILLHRGTLHVPLVIRGPSVPIGETDEWTMSTQLFDTLIELLGVALPAAEIPRSPSLIPLMNNGGTRPSGDPEFTAYFETIAPRTSQGWSQLVGWQRGDWRFVHGPKPRIWDLAADPEEHDDLAAAEPERVDALYRELAEFLGAFETRPVAESMAPMDAETRDRLAALGYLRADSEALEQFNDILAVEGLTDPADVVIDISIFSEAKAAIARGQWALAESLWNEVLRRSPDNPLAYQNLASIYGLNGNWDRCFEILQSGVERLPEAESVRRLLGSLLIEAGRPGDGLDVLLTLPTESLEAATWIGLGYQALGDSKNAKLWFRRGLEIAPENRWLRLYLANRLAEEGAYDEADTLFRSIIADAPYFHLAYYNLGLMTIARGRPDQARGLLERALALKPDHEPTRAALRRLDLAPHIR